MKAAVYYETGPPEVFRIEEVPDPACPADGVVVDVEAVSIEGGDVGHRVQGEMAARGIGTTSECIRVRQPD